MIYSSQNLPNFEAYYPPTVLNTISGRFIVSGSLWIEVDDSVGFDEARAHWVRSSSGSRSFREVDVPSSSGNGTYQVRIFSDGTRTCNCIGFSFHKRCKHTNQAR